MNDDWREMKVTLKMKVGWMKTKNKSENESGEVAFLFSRKDENKGRVLFSKEQGEKTKTEK